MPKTNVADIGLPSASDFKDVEVPEFERKYYRVQGGASTKKSQKGRLFTASGPKADLIVKIILADAGLTRKQIATVVHCSPSRVSEVIWALEAAVKNKQIESFPAVPRSAVKDDDEDETEEASDVEAEPDEDEVEPSDDDVLEPEPADDDEAADDTENDDKPAEDE